MTRIIQLEPARTARSITPRVPIRDSAARGGEVYVIYTSMDETIAAARLAADLGKARGVPVTLIHFRAIPFALPVDAPTGISPIETQAFTDRLRAENLDVNVRVCLCRSERDAISLALKPHSSVIIGRQRGWWHGSSRRWRRMLEAAGHVVVLASTDDPRAGSKGAAYPSVVGTAVPMVVTAADASRFDAENSHA